MGAIARLLGGFVLEQAQKDAIVAQVRTLERSSGAEVVTAVVARAHPYPDIVWSAFALAAALAGLAVVVLDRASSSWASGNEVLAAVATVLAAGAVSALLAIAVPAYARCFLRHPQGDAEVHRCARLAFHDHGLARAPGQRAVLVLAARFERTVDIVAGAGFDGHVDAQAWRRIAAAASATLRQHGVAAALSAALADLASVLQARDHVASHPNALPDAPIELAAP
jgi:uncharacterized membrane protein